MNPDQFGRPGGQQKNGEPDDSPLAKEVVSKVGLSSRQPRLYPLMGHQVKRFSGVAKMPKTPVFTGSY